MTAPETSTTTPVGSARPGLPSARGPARRVGLPVVLAVAVTVVLWASAFIGIRGAGPHFDPGALALLRMAVGSLALAVIAVRHGI